MPRLFASSCVYEMVTARVLTLHYVSPPLPFPATILHRIWTPLHASPRHNRPTGSSASVALQARI